MSVYLRSIFIVALIVAWAGYTEPVKAVPIVLRDGLSQAVIDPQSGEINSWAFRGATTNLGVRFRLDNTGGEQPLSELNLRRNSVTQNSVLLEYEDPNSVFDFHLAYALTSPLASRSVLTEFVRIENTSSEDLNFRLFQIVDATLGDPLLSHTIERVGLERVSEESSAFALDAFIDRSAILDRSTTPTTFVPISNTTELTKGSRFLFDLGFLGSDTEPTTLTDTPIDETLVAQSVMWAWQWDFVLKPSQPVLFSNRRYIMEVPEPAFLGITLIGLSCLVFLWKERKGT